MAEEAPKEVTIGNLSDAVPDMPTPSISSTPHGMVLTVIVHIVKSLYYLLKWFLIVFVPFVVQYIGIPAFAIGILFSLSMMGGTILFVLVFCAMMYYFIKGTIFKSKPKVTQ